MAVSFVSSAVTFGNGTTRSVSLDAGVGSDRAVVGGGYDVNLIQTVNSMRYDAVSMTEEATSGALKAFSLAGVPSGINILSLTLSAYSKPMLVGGSFEGVDQADPTGTPTTNSGAGATQSTANTTAPSDGMIWGVMRHSYASSARSISGAGNSLAGSIRDGSSGLGAAGGYRSSTGVISWSGGGSPSYNAIALPLNAAAAGLTVPIDPATEIDTANSITPQVDLLVNIGTATEIDTANSITPQTGLEVAIGTATEIDTANSIIPLSGTTVALGIATEIDTANSITPQTDLVVGIGIATEIDIANSIIPVAAALIAKCTLVDRNGNPLPGLSNLSWAWFDESDPANFNAPITQGELESTDGSGIIDIDLTGTSLAPGQFGTLILRSDNGVTFGAYNLQVMEG